MIALNSSIEKTEVAMSENTVVQNVGGAWFGKWRRSWRR